MTTLDRFTEVDQVREYIGGGADDLNILVATEASAHREVDGEIEEAYIYPWQEGTSFQAEGFILQPRKLRCFAFEVVTESKEDAIYILTAARDSQAPLAYQQAQAMSASLSANLLSRA